jgi:S-adenosylmethionine hydrolase
VRRSALRAESYAELGGGAVGLVLDSSGLLAVSMDQRSAAEELGLDVGDQVTLTASDDVGLTQQVTLRQR